MGKTMSGDGLVPSGASGRVGVNDAEMVQAGQVAVSAGYSTQTSNGAAKPANPRMAAKMHKRKRLRSILRWIAVAACVLAFCKLVVSMTADYEVVILGWVAMPEQVVFALFAVAVVSLLASALLVVYPDADDSPEARRWDWSSLASFGEAVLVVILAVEPVFLTLLLGEGGRFATASPRGCHAVVTRSGWADEFDNLDIQRPYSTTTNPVKARWKSDSALSEGKGITDSYAVSWKDGKLYMRPLYQDSVLEVDGDKAPLSTGIEVPRECF
ncbi:hypothetical protein [Bifidobacterium sp. ESL0790]|uniref:hypothetical protein n=1 Tax=Bifidobacterium sp. ESL0790 TaxID=2983233 RepID=UPI0023F7E22D|nr:hypothetical protein [Bifidobacterium sp. ESL0790]WEV72653.1 hypothetical protein OZY47_01305 [Bifidobacterium sp. ESL0790]